MQQKIEWGQLTARQPQMNDTASLMRIQSKQRVLNFMRRK